MSDYTKLFASWIIYKLALRAFGYALILFGICLFWQWISVYFVIDSFIVHQDIATLARASIFLGLVIALFELRSEYLKIKNIRMAEDEKARKKIEVEEAAAAKKEAARLAKLEKERGLLEKIKNELSTLSEDVEKSNQDFLIILTKKHQTIVKKVKQEQKQVKDLSERHEIIGKFLTTRGMDDLNSEVFKQLEKRLGSQ